MNFADALAYVFVFVIPTITIGVTLALIGTMQHRNGYRRRLVASNRENSALRAQNQLLRMQVLRHATGSRNGVPAPREPNT